MIHLGDITKLKGNEVPIVDVVTGGSPCQNFSVAGNRKGLGGDESVLFYHQIRLVKEMRQHDRDSGRPAQLVRPRYCVWENVPGAFSSNGGKDFQAVLTEFVRIAEPEAPDVPLPEKGKWPKSGCLYDELGRWSIAWRVHDAQFWGVPQRRKRISLVADFGGLSAPEILFERKGLSGDFEPSAETREDATRSIGESAESAIGVDLYNQTATGNVAKSLNSAATDADHILCVIHEPLCIEMTSTKNTIVEDGISPTLTARMGTGGNQVNAVMGFPLGFRAENTKCYHEAATTICNGTRPGFCAGVIEPMNIVRRLTPLECERLQGFPDNWTNIGDWTDSPDCGAKMDLEET